MSKNPAYIIKEKELLEKMQLDKLNTANKEKDKEIDKNDIEILTKENKTMKDCDDNSLSVDNTKESNDSNKPGINSNSNSNSVSNDDNFTCDKKDAPNETKENEEKENKAKDLSNIGFVSSKEIKNMFENFQDKFAKLEQDMEQKTNVMKQELEQKTNEMKQEMEQKIPYLLILYLNFLYILISFAFFLFHLLFYYSYYQYQHYKFLFLY